MTPTPEALRAGAVEITTRLRRAGHQAYFAGGCVRDRLLGHAPKDYDIVSDATPEAVARLFKRTLLVGAAFGVVKVWLGEGRDYEVATFRTDGAYSDGRRPDTVAYADNLEDDVTRRDFTINALAYDPETDRVIDLVGGQADLDARLVRAVGDPDARFGEDHLRMLRAVRFAARFGFELEAGTQAAITRRAGAIADVSRERIAIELDGVWSGPGPGRGLALLTETGLAPHVLPPGRALEAPAQVALALDRLAAVGGLDAEARCVLAWALILEGQPGPAVEEGLRGLRMSRERGRHVRALVEAMPVLAGESGREADRVRLAADERSPVHAALLIAWRGQGAEVTQAFEAIRARLSAEPLPPRPILSGRDLAALGLRPGPRFKALLDAVDVEVLERRVKTRDEALAFVRAAEP